MYLNKIELPDTSIEDEFEEAVCNFENIMTSRQPVYEVMYQMYDDKQLTTDEILLFTKIINLACEIEEEIRQDAEVRIEMMHRRLKTEYGKFLIKGGDDRE